MAKKKFFQLGFSSEIKVPQLGSARLGTFIARLGSSRKIPARAHHYQVPINDVLSKSWTESMSEMVKYRDALSSF